MFRVPIRIASTAHPEVARELQAVVDTGSAYTLVPRTVAEALGIRPIRRMEARLANGTRTVRDMGEAVVTIEEMRTTTWVVFGEPEDAVLLGAVTLQELALEVDPTAERLRPAEVYMFGAAWTVPGVTRPTPRARSVPPTPAA